MFGGETQIDEEMDENSPRYDELFLKPQTGKDTMRSTAGPMVFKKSQHYFFKQR
jgi:hypothetical protein